MNTTVGFNEPILNDKEDDDLAMGQRMAIENPRSQQLGEIVVEVEVDGGRV